MNTKSSKIKTIFNDIKDFIVDEFLFNYRKYEYTINFLNVCFTNSEENIQIIIPKTPKSVEYKYIKILTTEECIEICLNQNDDLINKILQYTEMKEDDLYI